MNDDRVESAQEAWSQRHDGVDATGSRWVSGWAGLTHALARPVARTGASPDAITVLGVLVAAAVPLLCLPGGAWPLVATAAIIVSALLDGVDGALASLTGTASRWGRVLDPLADRCADLLLVVALVVLGAPGWLGALLGALTVLLESVRTSAQLAGLAGPGAITVWERPSRVIVAAFATTAAGVGVPATESATALAAVGTALALVGLGHLVRAVRRGLPEKT